MNGMAAAMKTIRRADQSGGTRMFDPSKARCISRAFWNSSLRENMTGVREISEDVLYRSCHLTEHCPRHLLLAVTQEGLEVLLDGRCLRVATDCAASESG